jgi:DNA helicase-2/ATP-dependent DNA helicase PcrA
MRTGIEDKLRQLHSGDKEQLEVIFSPSQRILVEAPAGYGKTKTMISKIAYLIASNQLSNPKKILALTFSVNAAYKIKKDVAETLPIIFAGTPTSPDKLKNKVLATNYHGFCRRVLKIYGYLLNDNLKNIDLLKSIDDGNLDDLVRLGIGINYSDAKKISDYSDAVKRVDRDFFKANYDGYIQRVLTFFLPNNYIPYNAIILLTIELFLKHNEVLDFYRSYFPIIIVDEFQDTNILSWTLVRMLISDDTLIVLIGDALQRIYGFIGAMPDLMNIAASEYSMHKVVLKCNYRFKDNPAQLKLDRVVRENAKNPRSPSIRGTVSLKVFEANYQQQEAEGIAILAQELSAGGAYKTAILVKQRGRNTSKIIGALRKENIPFFYALYSDEDEGYRKFHQKASTIWLYPNLPKP